MDPAFDDLSMEMHIFVEFWDVISTDDPGHEPRSDYVERFWLPVLGPSTTWLLRYVATRLEGSPSGCALELSETARALGLGERSGRNGPFMRSLARMIDFELATMRRPGHLAIRRLLPTLSSRQLAHLPASLRAEHAREFERQKASSDPLRRRGVQLALSLLRLGENEEETVRQLLRWKYQPGLARSCVCTALLECPGGNAQPV